MKLFVFSGVAPGVGGTGRFVEYLYARRDDTEAKVVWAFKPTLGNVYRAVFREKRSMGTALYSEVMRGIHFLKCLIVARRHRSLLIHPQTIGFLSIRILLSFRRVSIFLLDSFFFCLRSYNYVPGEGSSCHECAHGPRHASILEKSCRSFPMRAPRVIGLRMIRALQAATYEVVWCQNRGQETSAKGVLEAKYFRVVGLVTSDVQQLLLETDFPREPVSSVLRRDLVVYHATGQKAKGLCYAIDLAIAMPEKTFLFPMTRHYVTKTCGIYAPPNVEFKPMHWESGLRDAVERAALVLCPSLWSAPIEGALVKSILLNGFVAVVTTVGSFAKDLPDGVVLKLVGDPAADAATIRAAFPDAEAYRLRGRDFITKSIKMYSSQLDRVCDVKQYN